MVEEEDAEDAQIEGNDDSLGGGSDADESEESNDEEEEERVVRKKLRKKKVRKDEYEFTVFGKTRKIRWTEWEGRQKDFQFTGESGVSADVTEMLAEASLLISSFIFLMKK